MGADGDATIWIYSGKPQLGVTSLKKNIFELLATVGGDSIWKEDAFLPFSLSEEEPLRRQFFAALCGQHLEFPQDFEVKSAAVLGGAGTIIHRGVYIRPQFFEFIFRKDGLDGGSLSVVNSDPTVKPLHVFQVVPPTKEFVDLVAPSYGEGGRFLPSLRNAVSVAKVGEEVGAKVGAKMAAKPWELVSSLVEFYSSASPIKTKDSFKIEFHQDDDESSNAKIKGIPQPVVASTLGDLRQKLMADYNLSAAQLQYLAVQGFPPKKENMRYLSEYLSGDLLDIHDIMVHSGVPLPKDGPLGIVHVFSPEVVQRIGSIFGGNSMGPGPVLNLAMGQWRWIPAPKTEGGITSSDDLFSLVMCSSGTCREPSLERKLMDQERKHFKDNYVLLNADTKSYKTMDASDVGSFFGSPGNLFYILPKGAASPVISMGVLGSLRARVPFEFDSTPLQMLMVEDPGGGGSSGEEFRVILSDPDTEAPSVMEMDSKGAKSKANSKVSSGGGGRGGDVDMKELRNILRINTRLSVLLVCARRILRLLPPSVVRCLHLSAGRVAS